mgnify:CR=1 FL=1
MSHLIEEYAKSLGVKISSPIVKDHYFPILFDKYITIHQASNVPSKTYSHYDIVLSLLKPFLERAKIKVIQLGGDTKIEGVDAALNVSFKQQSFILSKSLAHLGCDSAIAQLASHKKIPTVTLCGNAFSSNIKPIFSSGSLNTTLEPKWDKKPCFNAQDPKKQIDTINPEVVAQSVLDSLKIEKEDIRFTTKHIGAGFLSPVVEVVPTSFAPLRLKENQSLMVRCDYGCDEDAFLRYCNSYPVVIFSKDLIQPHGLQKIAQNVSKFYLFVDNSWDTIPDNYFNILQNMNIDLSMIVKEEKDLKDIRNKYFDIAVTSYYNHKEAPCELSNDARFMSSLRLIEGGKEYLSYAHWKKGLDSDNKVLDTPEYWRESDYFYIYERD